MPRLKMVRGKEKSLEVMRKSFSPATEKKKKKKKKAGTETKQKVLSLKSRYLQGMCSTEGGKVTGVWDLPHAQVFCDTSDDTRKEKRREAWGCRTDFWRRWDRARLTKKAKPQP